MTCSRQQASHALTCKREACADTLFWQGGLLAPKGAGADRKQWWAQELSSFLQVQTALEMVVDRSARCICWRLSHNA